LVFFVSWWFNIGFGAMGEPSDITMNDARVHPFGSLLHSVLIVPRLSLIVNRRSQLETGTWQLEPRGEAALRPAAVINPVILILQIVSPLGSL
jgi:hypothetical protein